MPLEEFQGFNQSDKMDQASFEKFKERMARAAAQIQAIRKEEKKRKKKEDELVKILLKFIQNSQKKDLVLLISRTLEKNIPANFILAVVLLGNEEIQKEIGEYLMLPGSQSQAQSQATDRSEGQPTDFNPTANEKALIFFEGDKTLPLKVRIEVDNWIKGLIYQASESPYKLLATAYDVVEEKRTEKENEEKSQSVFHSENTKKSKLVVANVLVSLTAHIIYDFLMQNKIEEDIVKLKEFSEFLIDGILNRTREDLDNRKELGGQVEDL